jgi:surface protein
MFDMFYCCNKLDSLDLSSFDTSNITHMTNMFAYCFNLTSLNLNNFNMLNVSNMDGVFTFCNNLKTLNIKNIKINDEKLSKFLGVIKYIQNVIINPKNNLLLYRKLKEVRYN